MTRDLEREELEEHGPKVSVEPRLKKGRLSIDVRELLEAMDKETVLELVSTIACHEEVLDQVAELVVEGMTSDGSYPYDWKADKARRRILEALPTIRLRVLEQLAKELEVTKLREAEASKMAWTLWHAWPEGRTRERPDVPGRTPTDAYLDAFDRARKTAADLAGGTLCIVPVASLQAVLLHLDELHPDVAPLRKAVDDALVTPCPAGPPPGPEVGQKWSDTSTTPPTLREWNGKEWIP